ncbi:MAG TPA: hypothetical protein PK024_02995 [Methanospirillum sp.]|uniref:hypothetical protein n=1 Tax=Methanospirillum sp. TaxID=45200 RepID=UPI002CC76620|nr:hypothetical protein [Methanospirillum sp.]HOJ95791.1 hypothetical protein [Methanospirillum sp.]
MYPYPVRQIIVRGVLDGGFVSLCLNRSCLFWFCNYPLVRTAYRMGRCGAYAFQLWYHLRALCAG